MTRIELLFIHIQIIELLRSTIHDTIKELEPDLNKSTIRKLLEASHALETEIMMSHARIRIMKDPTTENENHQ